MDECPSVYCVLVNWNGWQDTVECLDSLRVQRYPHLKVVVVDNGSTNNSVTMIRKAHPWVSLVDTGANLGFAGGCNIGIRLGLEHGAEYIWLLNNDTTVPDDTLGKLMHEARINPRAGAIGAVLYYMHDPGAIQAWGGGKINLWTGMVSHFTSPAKLNRNTYLTGACTLTPRHVYEEVGVLYEGFFMYYDDCDLGLRLHKAGYEIVVAGDTAVLHKEGASSQRRSPLIDRFITTSGLRLLKRHAPIPQLSIALFILLRLANRIRRTDWTNAAAVLRGIAVYRKEQSLQFSERA
jgi:GT2 family glycosyltransferase